jgi:hypothetical protein
MKTFHYLPPGVEEQRAFVMQLLGTLLGVGVVAFLSWTTRDAQLRAVLWGAALAVIYMLGRGAWQLELKARRSQLGEITLAEDGLHLIDREGLEQVVDWKSITACDVQGGKLRVVWPAGQLSVSAREVQDGMEMVREIAQIWSRANGQQTQASNFIPLTPK